ncbi:MAG: DUF4399 domain-containing protein [Gammaproteobacteria bacterium]|nr:DUF4399 domain-containing protein [Gammaproteobacteria bacterium]
MQIVSKLALITVVNLMINFSVLAGTPAPANAEVYFIAPADGATVSSPVTVVFGLKNMGVAPAGIDVANTGHHHLLIDVATPPDLDKPIPADDHHKHFGAGQTETIISLPPGKHTLQLLLGDKAHVPHTPAVMSKKITITVK